MFGKKKRQLLEPGARVSEFHLPVLEGGEKALSQMVAAGPALLAFFKVSCPVCQLTFPFLERLQSSGKLPVYGISQNNARDTREFNRRFGITLPTLLDSSDSGYAVSNAFGIAHVPTLFLIGVGRSIERVTEGWNKTDIRELGALAGVNPFRPEDSVPEAKAG